MYLSYAIPEYQNGTGGATEVTETVINDGGNTYEVTYY